MSRIRRSGPGILIRILVAISGLLATGCNGPGSSSATKPAALPFRGETLVVAAVGEPGALPTVAAQRGEWEESRGASCQIVKTPVEASNPGGAHVLVFSGDQLGDLVDAGALAVLPETVVQPPVADASAEKTGADADSDSLQFDDVIPAYREQVTKYGPDRMALPLGGSALVLVYNRAALTSEANRTAAKQAGVSLDLPATWKDLDALARFFHGRDWDGDGDGDGSENSGIALALGADPEGVGDATFLARAAALGQHRDNYSLLFDYDTMAPLVASPPFVEALEGLVALKAFGPPGVEQFDAEAAAKAFREGKAALLIDRAERAGRWGGGKVKSIGVAPLPGSERVYQPKTKVWETTPLSKPNRPSYLPHGGGWLVAVAASAKGRQREAAIDFITYLVNPETSKSLRSDRDFPMLPVRGSQVGQGLPDPRLAPGVESRAWSEALSKTVLAPRVVVGLRIPRADGYLADLSQGRIAAVKGEPAEKALKTVAENWSARTRSLGQARQAWHYSRSLNGVVTTPTPPPREEP